MSIIWCFMTFVGDFHRLTLIGNMTVSGPERSNCEYFLVFPNLCSDAHLGQGGWVTDRMWALVP